MVLITGFGIRHILSFPEFQSYLEIFNKFGFGDKIKAKILTRIYPFENYLLDGYREFIEYERREVKKEERSFKNGSVYLKYSKGEIKRIKRNRSRDSFKLRLGFGTILESSGDSWKMIPHGSSLCRKSMFQHVITKVEPNRTNLPDNHINQQIYQTMNDLKSAHNFRGVHIQSKLMSKIVNLLYKEFKNSFCRRS